MVLLALLASVALMTAQSNPLPTATPSTSRINKLDIYVRGGPGESYIPVGRLVLGNVPIPVGRNAETTWILIRYYDGFGWIRSDLAFWVEDLEALPIVDPNNLTPSPVPGQITGTPFFVTETPESNWVNVGSEGAFVRAGPGRGYWRLGTLSNGDVIADAVGRNAEANWIMFRYGDGFGWIQRNLVHWSIDLNRLPVLSENALTPSATFTHTPTSTLTFTPSATWTATYTNTPTNTPSPTSTSTPTDTPTLTPSLTPTSTPTPTLTATLTQTPTSTLTLTPTATTTPTSTPSATPTTTPSPTETSTSVPSETPTNTETVTFTAVSSATPQPSNTATHTTVPSDTPRPTETPAQAAIAVTTEIPSQIPAATDTPVPTETPSLTPTSTPTNTDTPTLTPSQTPTATFTREPSATSTNTSTPLPAETSSSTPTNTPVASATPTQTPSLSPTSKQATSTAMTETPAPSLTESLIPTSTSAASSTATETATPPTETPSQTPAAAAVGSSPVPATPQPVSPEGGGPRFPMEAVVAGGILLVVLGYVVIYLRATAAVDRYDAGFVLEECPVCRRGHLTVESRHERLLGIPRPRRIVRCSVCRSVLRETGYRRWRYAVDRTENPTLFERYNGQEIDEDGLKGLANQPPVSSEPIQPKPPVTPPSFVDDEEN